MTKIGLILLMLLCIWTWHQANDAKMTDASPNVVRIATHGPVVSQTTPSPVAAKPASKAAHARTAMPAPKRNTSQKDPFSPLNGF